MAAAQGEFLGRSGLVARRGGADTEDVLAAVAQAVPHPEMLRQIRASARAWGISVQGLRGPERSRGDAGAGDGGVLPVLAGLAGLAGGAGLGELDGGVLDQAWRELPAGGAAAVAAEAAADRARELIGRPELVLGVMTREPAAGLHPLGQAIRWLALQLYHRRVDEEGARALAGVLAARLDDVLGPPRPGLRGGMRLPARPGPSPGQDPGPSSGGAAGLSSGQVPGGEPDDAQVLVVAARGLQVMPDTGGGTAGGGDGAGGDGLLRALLDSAPEAFGPVREPAGLRVWLGGGAGEGADAADGAGGVLGAAAGVFGLRLVAVEPGGGVRAFGRVGHRQVTVVAVAGRWGGTAGRGEEFRGARIAWLLQRLRAARLAGDAAAGQAAWDAIGQALIPRAGEFPDDVSLLNLMRAAIWYWLEHGHLEPSARQKVTPPGGPEVNLGARLNDIRQRQGGSWARPALGVMGLRWDTGSRGGKVATARRELAARLRAEGEARRGGDPGAVGAAVVSTEKALAPGLGDGDDVAWLREAVAWWRGAGSLDLPPGGGPAGLGGWLAGVAEGQVGPAGWIRAALGVMGLRWRADSDLAQIAVLADAERAAWLSGDTYRINEARRNTDWALAGWPGMSDAGLLGRLRAVVGYWREHGHLETGDQQAGTGEQWAEAGAWLGELRGPGRAEPGVLAAVGAGGDGHELAGAGGGPGSAAGPGPVAAGGGPGSPRGRGRGRGGGGPGRR